MSLSVDTGMKCKITLLSLSKMIAFLQWKNQWLFFPFHILAFLFLWRQKSSSIDQSTHHSNIQRFFSWLRAPIQTNICVCDLHPCSRMWAAQSKCMGQYQFRGRVISGYRLGMIPAKSCSEWRTLGLMTEMKPMH